MVLTLLDAKVGMANKVDQQVIDTFRRESLLMDRLIYDDAVSPGTGGSTLVYGYQQIKTPATAGFRAINSEYTANEAIKEAKTVKLAVLGGSFQIDRVIQSTSGQVAEATFQMEQKIKGARNAFHNAIVNGSSAVDANSFDGLNKLLTGTSTELGTTAVIDLTAMATQAAAFAFLDKIDDFLSELDGVPTMLMGNSKLINKIKSAARYAGYLSQTEDAFGKTVDAYNGIPLVDLGFYTSVSGGTPTTASVVGIFARTVGTAQTGLTDLYAVNVGIDGFHGVTPMGGIGIHSYLPDFNAPGAMKTGEVEMIVGMALKNSRKAGVLRNLKVQ